jgi:cytochrome c oxidase assembly protein subunit 11
VNAVTALERAKRRTGWLAALGACAMIAAAYAAVPLYRLFCQVTGYGGTVAQVEAAALPDAARLAALGGASINVRFDATTGQGLPWRFRPVDSVHEVRIGEKVMAYYEAENLSDVPVTGRAVYNVSRTQRGPISGRSIASALPSRHCSPARRSGCPWCISSTPACSTTRARTGFPK